MDYLAGNVQLVIAIFVINTDTNIKYKFDTYKIYTDIV